MKVKVTLFKSKGKKVTNLGVGDTYDCYDPTGKDVPISIYYRDNGDIDVEIRTEAYLVGVR